MTTLNKATQNQLRQFIEQLERLDEDRKGIVGDIADKFAEAKALGFDVKAMKKILAMRKKSETEREEEESILHVYMHALGMLDQEDLFESREDRVHSLAKAHGISSEVADSVVEQMGGGR